MYRAPAIAVLVAATAFSPDLEAQMRAMARPSGPSAIAGSRLRVAQSRPSGFRSINARPFGQRNLRVNSPFRRHIRFNIFLGNSCFGTFIDSFFCRQFFFSHRFFFTQPVFIPYPVYSAPYYPIAEQPSPTVIDRESDSEAEIDRLRDEVERLRGEEESRAQARPAANPPAPVQENEPTLLVFRDGHQSEVRNYAIVGQTLWALTEQRARKLSLSDLDMEATKKVNADRGVEMRLP